MYKRQGNKYLADTGPWKLIKTDPERVKTIMNIALQITANLSIVLQPFLPNIASKLEAFLNISNNNWNNAGSNDLLSAGHRINKPEILFTKVDDELVEAEVKLLEEKAKENMKFEPQKEETSFDDFMKMDVRLGKILTAEKVEKADKLLKLTVDTGIDTRTIVSGIAQHYSTEEVIGKTVTVLLNLAPRKIRGIESQGMILMAENAEGELAFVSPEKEFEPGSGVR